MNIGFSRQHSSFSGSLDPLEPRRLLSAGFHGTDGNELTQTNLLSDGSIPALHTDPDLVNAWGISASPTSPFWVSDNGTGKTEKINGDGVKQGSSIDIPGVGGQDAAPTGQVFNNTSGFVLSDGAKALFIFAGEDGGITGWNMAAGSTALLAKDSSPDHAVYKGLAIGQANGNNYLYATDFHNGKVRVFDDTFTEQNWAGAFTDPSLPSGYAPFNIQNLDGKLYVTYAKQDDVAHDDVPGAGHGFVDVYDTSGVLLERFNHVGLLNSPWGLAKAPQGFGQFGGDVLVGQFGSGKILAFNPDGKFDGQLRGEDHKPIVIDGLWGLRFGNGGNAGSQGELFFSAGPNHESEGLFGKLTSDDDSGKGEAPPPSQPANASLKHDTPSLISQLGLD